MTEPVWWCPECGCNDSELADRPWHLAKPPSPDFPVKWEKCPGTPVDLIAERERLLAGLKEIWCWGISVPMGMTEEQYRSSQFGSVMRYALRVYNGTEDDD